MLSLVKRSEFIARLHKRKTSRYRTASGSDRTNHVPLNEHDSIVFFPSCLDDPVATARGSETLRVLIDLLKTGITTC